MNACRALVRVVVVCVAVAGLALCASPWTLASDSSAPPVEEGFVSLFNGKDLTGWDGDQRYWSVRNGAITAQTTADGPPLTVNNFLIWQGGQPREFELRLQFRIENGNSGIYFHSEKQTTDPRRDPRIGLQADISGGDQRWTGVIMEYLKRDVLAERGQRVVIDEQGRKQVSSLGDPAELLKAVNEKDWNDYTVIVRGEQTILQINGVTMCELTDRDPRRTRAGYLALQVHVGPPMLVQFRNIRMRQF